MPSRLAWLWSGLWGRNLPELTVALEFQMEDLEDYLRELHQENSFGPVPGSYITIRFNELDKPVAAGTQDLILTPFAFRPIAVSVWGYKGGAVTPIFTVQLRYDVGAGPVDVFSSDKQVTQKELFNKRGDFAVDSIPAEADLYLHVVSVGDSGSAVIDYLRVTLVGKNASKVEQA